LCFILNISAETIEQKTDMFAEITDQIGYKFTDDEDKLLIYLEIINLELKG
jgi:hypothetical protein